MAKFFSTVLPRRTLALSCLETFVVLALLLGLVLQTHQEGWLWLRYEGGFLRIGSAAAIFLLCMYYYDLYDSLVMKSLRESLTRLPEVLGTVYLVLAAAYLVAPTLRLGLANVLLGVASCGLGIALVREVYAAVAHSSRFAEPFVLVGTGRLAEALAFEIKSRPEFGIRLVAVLPEEASGKFEAGLRPEGSPAGTHNTSIGVILALDRNSGQTSLPWKKSGQVVLNGAGLYETITGKVWLESLHDDQFWAARSAAALPLQRVGKRLASVVLSFSLLLLALPIMAAVALAVWLDSGSPVIFRQRRIGQYGQQFTLYKFRTMQSKHHGPFHPTMLNDERCTRAGRWLRRTRLDELPQLWNVLRGNMSFVGPRPFACEEEREWAQTIPFYGLRWSVKPGATGWAQIQRGYCATRDDNVEKLAYDLFYIKNLSLGLDLLILFQTTKILLQGRGAR